jgi:hypothetical protein
LKLISVDADGLVNKLSFSKNILWSTYSVESECLLDGTAGQILAVNVLQPYKCIQQQLPVTMPSLKRLGLIALSSERSSFAVAVEPKVHVLHRWARPPPECMDVNSLQTTDSSQVYLPCLSWGWALVSGGGHVITPILARAWGCCLQLLLASFPETEENNTNTTLFQWPAFGVHDEVGVHAPVVALEWLSDRSLVYLTVTNKFTIIDTVMITLLERLDFLGLKLVYAEFSLSGKAAASNGEGGGEGKSNNNHTTAFCTTFQNLV